MTTSVRRYLSACASLAALTAAPAWGQVLYSQNFDVDDTANWTVNNGPGTEAHNFFFDYSAVGIPTAPNAAGGTTRGMKLQANLTSPVFTGMSVSPTGKSFTGDYSLTFDVWSNYIGNETNGINNIAATTGSSMLSQFGILTSGTVPCWPGTGDGVWFTAMSDTSSTAYRTYSSERTVSYKGTVDTDDPAPPPNSNYDPLIDVHNTYFATDANGKTTRSNNPNSTVRPPGQLYLDSFPVVTVPTAQTNADPEPGNPGVDLSATQFGSSPVAGVFGFAWHEVEISKVGNLVSWKVDDVLFATVDTTNFAVPTGGTNILFGHSDINAGTSADPNFPHVQFTLIDNIVVTVASTPADTDFDNDGDTDGADIAILSRNFGGAGNNGQGDANGDGQVNGDDYNLWQGAFGSAVAATAGVPEPATGALLGVAVLALAARGRRRLPCCAIKKSVLPRLALCGVALAAASSSAQAQSTVGVSLNLRYTDPFDPTEGGTWTLVAKTNSPNGIQMINAIMNNVNGTGVTFNAGINAATLTGNPIVNGTIVELLYLQNPSVPASVVLDVGGGAGTPGNVANDPLKNTAWNNVASIATGTFSGVRPTFTANGDTPPDVTDANTFSTSTAPFNMSAAGTVSTTVRGDSFRGLNLENPAGTAGLRQGDANRDFTVTGADFAILQNNFNQAPGTKGWDTADFNDDGNVSGADFALLQNNFNLPTTPPSIGAVPEPASACSAVVAVVALAAARRRRASI